ncbi:MAG: ABC transporter substrate-binding protein [Pseudobdellovibrionaceae bacterium]|jgi:branched-chain amino acid transport system substrate-binding protein
MQLNWKKLLSASLVLSFALTSGCTKKNSNEIVVGHFGSMTGADATFGQSTDEGIRLAIDEVNAAGGVNGKKIKLITMDTQGKSEEAASVVTRLIEQEKVVAVLGEVASTRSLAAAPIAQAKKIPMITPSSTNPKVTEVGDYIFRVCFIDPFQGTVMAKFAVENLKAKKVAILREVSSDYSMGLSDFFIAKFKELGGEIVADASYQNQDKDFKAQLTQIKSKNPEAIFVPGYYTQVGLIARQARELGIKAPLMGGDGWDSSKLFEIGGEAVNGGYFSNHYSTDSTDPAAIEFMAKFKAKYNKSPDGLSAAGYDAAQVLVAAMKTLPEVTPSALREAIAKTTNFPGATGNITINEQRNATKSAVVVQVQGPTNKFMTSIAP